MHARRYAVALCLTVLMNLSQVAVSEAVPLQITRGAHGAWHWGCYIGGKSGLGCTISTYPIDVININMFGVPEFSGPDINQVLTRPQSQRMMMRIDDAEKIKVDNYSPNSFSVIQEMLKGRVLRVEYQGMFDAEIHEVEVPLAGLNQSYCDALHYLRDHGPGVPFETLPSAPCMMR